MECHTLVPLPTDNHCAHLPFLPKQIPPGVGSNKASLLRDEGTKIAFYRAFISNETRNFEGVSAFYRMVFSTYLSQILG